MKIVPCDSSYYTHLYQGFNSHLPSILPTVNLFTYLCIHPILPVIHPSIHPSIHLSIYSSIHPFVHLLVHLSTHAPIINVFIEHFLASRHWVKHCCDLTLNNLWILPSRNLHSRERDEQVNRWSQFSMIWDMVGCV